MASLKRVWSVGSACKLRHTSRPMLADTENGRMAKLSAVSNTQCACKLHTRGKRSGGAASRRFEQTPGTRNASGEGRQPSCCSEFSVGIVRATSLRRSQGLAARWRFGVDPPSFSYKRPASSALIACPRGVLWLLVALAHLRSEEVESHMQPCYSRCYEAWRRYCCCS